MYVHPGRRLVYLAHPKTGTHSVQRALLDRGFLTAVGNRHLPVVERNSAGPSWHHRRLTSHPGDGWVVFTTVRNHFDAWASWYAYVQTHAQFADLRGAPFDPAFLEAITRRVPEYFPDPGRLWALHSRHADCVLRFESQEAELGELLGERGLTLEKLNVSEAREGRGYREMISPELRAYIEVRYGRDLNEWGYEW